MKWILGAAMASSLFLSACAQDDFSTNASTQSASPVAGEKTGEGGVTPGVSPGGASASVPW